MFEFEAELEKLNVQENDTFLLRVKRPLSIQAVHNLRVELDGFLTVRGFKNVKVLILQEDMVLEKLCAPEK